MPRSARVASLLVAASAVVGAAASGGGPEHAAAKEARVGAERWRGYPLYVVRADGHARRFVSPIDDFAVAPDGRQLAFTRAATPGGRGLALWVTLVRGGPLRRITPPHVDPLSFAWAPKSDRIAYTARNDVYVAAAGTRSTPRRIARRGAFPSWSADGRRLAWAEHRSGTGPSMFVVATAEGKVLWRRAGEDPVWSPAGRRIMYMQRARGRAAIATAAGEIVWTVPAAEHLGWAPSGGAIAFYEEREAAPASPTFIGVVATRQVKRLPESAVCCVAWSRDSRRLAWDDDDEPKIHIGSASGRILRTLPYWGYGISWSRAGGHVLLAYEGRLWVASATGGRRTLVADVRRAQAGEQHSLDAEWAANDTIAYAVIYQGD